MYNAKKKGKWVLQTAELLSDLVVVCHHQCCDMDTIQPIQIIYMKYEAKSIRSYVAHEIATDDKKSQFLLFLFRSETPFISPANFCSK